MISSSLGEISEERSDLLHTYPVVGSDGSVGLVQHAVCLEWTRSIQSDALGKLNGISSCVHNLGLVQPIRINTQGS